MKKEAGSSGIPAGAIERLADRLRAEVCAGVPTGLKLDSLRKLAGRFGVSPITMWQALGLLVHEGTLRARHGAGYYVAERIRKQHVGVLLELDLSLPNVSRFWPRVVKAIRRGLRAQGYRSRFYAGEQVPSESGTAGPPCQDLIEDIEEDRLSGLIVVWGNRPGSEYMRRLERQAAPVVGNGAGYPARVQLDYIGLVSEATRRLLAEGRRRLAFMEWGPSEPDPRERSALFNAFLRELALHGATLNERWVRSDLHPASDGAGWEEFREIWLADSEKPDGLIVADDVLCMGAAQAIQELGLRVPGQLRVVAHGNKGSGIRYPFPVSVLECDPEEYAQAMVELMVRQLRHEPLERPGVMIPFRWAEGGTRRSGGVSTDGGVVATGFGPVGAPAKTTA